MSDTFEDYRKLDAVNATLLKQMRTSPLHYRHAKDNERPDNDTFRLGRATHTAVLEPDRLPLDYVVFTGERRAGKEWEAFRGAAMGRTILTEAQYEKALAIRDAVRNHPLVSPYLRSGLPEHTLTWTDDVTGLRCKARLDWFSKTYPCVLDLKTARNIDERAFGQAAARLGYHNQMAWYCAGAIANGLLVEPRAVIVAVESEAPHDVAVYNLDEHAIACGMEENAELLGKLKECIDTDNWPGRYSAEMTLALPHWLFGDDEEDPEEMGFRRASGE